MTENRTSNDTSPVGVVVTIKEIHEAVGRIEGALTGEITKLKIRIAAHEVIIGMMTIVIVFLAQKGLTV
jgi:hypothetical protein